MAPAPSTARGSKWNPAFREAVEAFGIGECNVILLHGPGTLDLVRPGQPLLGYFERGFSTKCKVVVTYSLSAGITFAQPHMRESFFATLEMEDKTPDKPLKGYTPVAAVSMIFDFLRKADDQSACAIIHRIDNMVGVRMQDANATYLSETLHNIGTDPILHIREQAVILTTPALSAVRSDVYPETSGMKLIRVDKPEASDREAFMADWLAREAEPITLKQVTTKQVANMSAGMSRHGLEVIGMRARANNHTLTTEIVKSVQRELMDQEFAGLVKRVDTTFTMSDVGGNVEAKALFMQRVIKPLATGVGAERVPMNILLVGPPGTAKTMTANAAANESGLNCLEVDLANLLGGIVGETEGKVKEFRRAAVENAPTMLIFDEVDQKIRRGEGGPDSGGGGSVENRLFAAVLEHAGDTSLKGRVVNVFISNRPELLDDAFMSRMQVVIPMLPVDSDTGRADVLARIANRLDRTLKLTGDEGWLTLLGARVANWSGRDLEQVVDEALAIVGFEGKPLSEAMADAISYRRANTTDVTAQVASAIRYTKDLRLLPERYRKVAERMDAAESAPDTKANRKAGKPGFGISDDDDEWVINR